MSDIYKPYEILTDKVNLPDRLLPKNIEISTVSNRSDLNKLLDLFLKIFPDEIDSEKAMQLRALQIPKYDGCFIARIYDKIIGFLIAGITNQVGYISYLGVEDRYRGQGVATALLKHLKLYLKQNGVQKLRCTIRKDNKKTLGYIDFLGFQLLG